MDRLDKNIEQKNALSLFAAEMRARQAQLTGDQSVTAETQKQTATSIATSLRGLRAASTGLNTTGELMKGSVVKLKAALDEWKWDQMKSLGLSLCSSIASIVEVAGGNFGSGFKALKEQVLVLKSWGAAWDAVGEIGDTLGKFGELASSILGTLGALGDIGAHLAKLDLDPKIADLLATEIVESSEVAKDMQHWAQLPNSTQSGDVIEVLTTTMAKLNDDLPSMGNGAWDQYVVNAQKTFRKFLTGYDKGVNAAAEEYITHLKSQAQYGNDFSTQGVRYVAAVQQYLINAAQMQANKNTQKAVDRAYDVRDSLKTYDMMQESILGIQVTNLALQMQTTMHQLCESYRYQTTRLYDECVVVDAHDGNVLNQVCGKFADGAPAFEPLLTTPCQDQESPASSISLAMRSQRYLHKWEGMYANARTVNNYIKTAVWGKDTQAADNKFIQVKLEVYDPPACSEGFWETTSTLCDISAGEHAPEVVFSNGTECLVENNTPREGTTCCKTKLWNPNCAFDPPEDRPYITRDAFKRFTDKGSEDWGKMTFSLASISRADTTLQEYDEIFIRGVGAYLEGAEIDELAASDLHVRLTPIGQMITRVKDRDWWKDEGCVAAKEKDGRNLCAFKNHTFVGAPSGGQATVSYTTKYHNPAATKFNPCHNLNRQPVFYERREIQPSRDYCTSLDFASLESGDPRALYPEANGPYNFASLYSSFELAVYNRESVERRVDIRSRGIRLEDVQAVRLGLWLKTNGPNNARQDTCKDISRGKPQN